MARGFTRRLKNEYSAPVFPYYQGAYSMRMKVTDKGFSMIETLVVCVIVAILAGVSIPLYSGYINNQRKVTCTNLAATAAAAGNAYWRRTGTDVPTGSYTPNQAPLFLYFNANKTTVSVTGSVITVTDKEKTSISDTASYK
jgi:prepilin-type N-terminal cleavage/methylation domain-containing protein